MIFYRSGTLCEQSMCVKNVVYNICAAASTKVYFISSKGIILFCMAMSSLDLK